MFGTSPSSNRKRIDAVWLPVAMQLPVLGPHAVATRGRTRRSRARRELDQHPFGVGNAAVEPHAVVEARPSAHLPRRSGDGERHHVGDEGEHRRGDGAAVAASGPERHGRPSLASRAAPRASRCACSSCRRRARPAWTASAPADDSGSPTVGIGDVLPGQAVVDGDPRGSDGDERGPARWPWPARAPAPPACPPRGAPPPRSTMSPRNGWLTNWVEHQSTSRWVAASIATTDTASPVPP